MKAELVDISECKKNFEIEVPQDIVDVEITHIAQEIARRARVPGFRPGKAPIGIVKTRYRDEIVSEMMQHLLPKYFGEAVEERKLDIVEAPHFEGIDYAIGQPLRFKAAFEVYPHLNIANYIDIPVEEISSKVEESRKRRPNCLRSKKIVLSRKATSLKSLLPVRCPKRVSLRSAPKKPYAKSAAGRP